MLLTLPGESQGKPHFTEVSTQMSPLQKGFPYHPGSLPAPLGPDMQFTFL